MTLIIDCYSRPTDIAFVKYQRLLLATLFVWGLVRVEHADICYSYL